MCPDFFFLLLWIISTWMMKNCSNAIVVGQGLIISCNKQRHADGLYLPQVFLPFQFEDPSDIYVYNYIFVCVVIRVSGEHENIHVQKYNNMTYIFSEKKTHRSILLLFCRFDMWYHMELSLIKSLKMENKTYVKCNMFKRGNNLFSYYRKNRELYICICKRSLRTFSFLHRRYFTNAPQGYMEVFFFIYSICNYVMYRWGIDMKKLYKISITLGTPEHFWSH